MQEVIENGQDSAKWKQGLYIKLALFCKRYRKVLQKFLPKKKLILQPEILYNSNQDRL